jgi:DNA-binding MarR family transcriptional regulator
MENKPDRVQKATYLIRRLMQAGAYHTKDLNKKYGVSTAQIACLLALYEEGPSSLSHIAKKIMVRSSTLTGIIDRLEQKGLVVRIRESMDRRIITIRLTEAGQRLAQNAPPIIPPKIVDGLRQLAEDEGELIIQSLEKLSQMIDSQDMAAEFEQEVL